MRRWTVVHRGLRHHWRTNLGVLVGSAVATAVLAGALAMGDSVRGSLRRAGEERLGRVHLATLPQGRYFTGDLAGRLSDGLGVAVAPLLQASASASLADGSAGVARAQVLGVDERFWALSASGEAPAADWADGVVLNEALAGALGVGRGDTILLRVRRGEHLAGDAPLSRDGAQFALLRLPVSAVAGAGHFGRFSLQSDPSPQPTAFVPLALLGESVDRPGRANVLLTGPLAGADPAAVAADALGRSWTLEDAGLSLRAIEDLGQLELWTAEVFLPATVSRAARAVDPAALGVFTYFLREATSGERTSRYFLASGIGPLDPQAGRGAVIRAVMPEEPGADGIVLNEWLADELQAGVGDEVTLSYWTMGPMRRLDVQERSFRVRHVTAIEGLAADPLLMPPFPGLAEVDDCRQWDPGVPIDLARVQGDGQLQQYWDRHRGTPKAFIDLRVARQEWSNRFGDLTAVRFAGGPGDADALAGALLAELTPASVGLVFDDARVRARAAAAGSTDFGGLFIGFSLFLIVAAVLLTSLLFVFGVQHRSEEIGTLLAVGWRGRGVRRLLLTEGAILAAVGGMAGLVGGIAYTAALLAGLRTVWSEAVAHATIELHVWPGTLATAWAIGFGAGVAAMLLAARHLLARPVRALLNGSGPEGPAGGGPGRGARVVGVVLGAGAGGVLTAAALGVGSMAVMFFVAGALLLGAAMAGAAAWLGRREPGGEAASITLGRMGLRNASRRWGRSLATVALLACGSFLVVAVAANRADPLARIDEPTGPAGGFALYAETASHIVHDLNCPDGRHAAGLDGWPADAHVVALRLREGDDASCFNLNRPQSPRLLGVDPAALAGRFRFAAQAGADGRGWALLDEPQPDGAIPAVADQATLQWALGKGLGDTLTYTDDAGEVFQVRLVGGLEPSVLQGQVLLSERAFVEKFGTTVGYRVFLIQAPGGVSEEAGRTWERSLADYGAWSVPTGERLSQFAAVQNTYLAIFGVVGGLGLVLGSAGLAVVVGRNVLERRGELALLRGVGFGRSRLVWMVLAEHWVLLACGLVAGVLAAGVATAPALGLGAGRVSLGSLAAVLAAVLAGGLIWTWLAARLALRGDLLDALRQE